LLKRSKLPKKYAEIAPDLTKIGTNTSAKVQYYTERDLALGGVVNVYGRELKVCRCDAWTKDFYMRNYAMTNEDFPDIANGQYEVTPPPISPPDYNGFGHEEDSLGSFLYLMPKVPKVDFKKQMENDGLNLRYLTKFANPQPEDKNRRFIVTYFMNNDTISIYEKFSRNSGFIGGSFLERGRVKDPATGEFYTTHDITVDTSIVLNFYKFEVLEADAFTQDFIRNNPMHFSQLAQEKALQILGQPGDAETSF